MVTEKYIQMCTKANDLIRFLKKTKVYIPQYCLKHKCFIAVDDVSSYCPIYSKEFADKMDDVLKSLFDKCIDSMEFEEQIDGVCDDFIQSTSCRKYWKHLLDLNILGYILDKEKLWNTDEFKSTFFEFLGISNSFSELVLRMLMKILFNKTWDGKRWQ